MANNVIQISIVPSVTLWMSPINGDDNSLKKMMTKKKDKIPKNILNLDKEINLFSFFKAEPMRMMLKGTIKKKCWKNTIKISARITEYFRFKMKS